MTTVFVDTSGFYAFLDKTDPFHREAKELFLRGREENWGLLTSSLVVQETWALIQARLGWEALEDWLCSLLPLCQVVWIDECLYELGAARAPSEGTPTEFDRLCFLRGHACPWLPRGDCQRRTLPTEWFPSPLTPTGSGRPARRSNRQAWAD